MYVIKHEMSLVGHTATGKQFSNSDGASYPAAVTVNRRSVFKAEPDSVRFRPY